MSKPAIFVRGEDSAPRSPAPRERQEEWERVREALDGIRHGEVRVVIQDGVVVQIERLEKQRLR